MRDMGSGKPHCVGQSRGQCRVRPAAVVGSTSTSGATSIDGTRKGIDFPPEPDAIDAEIVDNREATLAQFRIVSAAFEEKGFR